MTSTVSEIEGSVWTAVTYRIWGGLDILYLLMYVQFSFAENKLPFIDDGFAIIRNLKQIGEIGAVVYESSYLIVFLSLAVSGVMLVLRKPAGKVIAYVQTPFRFVFMIPSISLLTLAIPHFQATDALIITTFLLSETIKVGSLVRWG